MRVDEADRTNAPIFVVGASRSGTALIRSVLNRHECIHIAGETHYFDDLRRKLGDAATRPLSQSEMELCARYFLPLAHRPYGHGGTVNAAPLAASRLHEEAARLDVGGDGYLEAFCRLHANLERRPSRLRRWGEKTPRHVFRLPEIFERYPNAQVIAIIRDPRAVVASYRDWHLHQHGEEADEGYAQEARRTRHSYDPGIISMMWRAAARAAIEAHRQHGRDRVLLQRYEDLVSEPEATCRHVSGWLGLPFSSAMLDVPLHNSSFEAFDESAGVRKEPVDRWKRILRPKEIAIVQHWSRKEMQQFGYELTRDRLSTAEALWATARSVCRGIDAVIVNRHRAGRLPSYVWRRLRLVIFHA